MTSDDTTLVREFAAHQSERAFTALVERHVALVYSAALRQTGDPHLAEEITQTVFTILARKVATLGKDTILPAWLYRTTRYVAGNALKMQHRRRVREHKAYLETRMDDTTSTGDNESQVAWEQMAPLLDDTMEQLVERDRSAVVLRYFENRPWREVAELLHLTEGAAQKRVTRALGKLRVLFAKRGVVVSTALIAGAVSANSVQAVPASMATTISTAALTGSAESATTLFSATKILAMTTLQKIAVTALLAVSVGAGMYEVTHLRNARAEPQTWPPMDKDFVQTNGEYVKIGGIAVKTNSPLNTDYFKQFKWRQRLLDKVLRSGAPDRFDRFVEGSWQLIKDYPNEANGYQNLMMAIEDYEGYGEQAKALAVANRLATSSAPPNFKLWAKGFLNRIDSQHNPVTLQFTAVDGRNVDLAAMRGKVVLVDFWATHCAPCVAELPRVKTAFEKFHADGFEVIGISCDTDQKELDDYVKQHGIIWPQYFDGKQQDKNGVTVAFGIDGIPHMFLIDKKGLLRFDDVRADDDVHPKGDKSTFEDKISKLLAEK